MPNVLVYLVSLFGSGSDDDHLGMVSWMDVDAGKFYDGDDDDDPGLISRVDMDGGQTNEG